MTHESEIDLKERLRNRNKPLRPKTCEEIRHKKKRIVERDLAKERLKRAQEPFKLPEGEQSVLKCNTCSAPRGRVNH